MRGEVRFCFMGEHGQKPNGFCPMSKSDIADISCHALLPTGMLGFRGHGKGKHVERQLEISNTPGQFNTVPLHRQRQTCSGTWSQTLPVFHEYGDASPHEMSSF